MKLNDDRGLLVAGTIVEARNPSQPGGKVTRKVLKKDVQDA